MLELGKVVFGCLLPHSFERVVPEASARAQPHPGFQGVQSKGHRHYITRAQNVLLLNERKFDASCSQNSKVQHGAALRSRQRQGTGSFRRFCIVLDTSSHICCLEDLGEKA